MVRATIQAGAYLDLDHATVRQQERSITRPEYLHVLETGYHEKQKDEFRVEYKAWTYSIRGRTLDGRELRVPVSFEEDGTLLVITVIDLDA